MITKVNKQIMQFMENIAYANNKRQQNMENLKYTQYSWMISIKIRYLLAQFNLGEEYYLKY